MRRRPPSQFTIGSFVRLAPEGPVYRIIWRGKLLQPRHSDWPGEPAVYRLDDDHWDCHYEYQLQPARPWDNDVADVVASAHYLYSAGTRW